MLGLRLRMNSMNYGDLVCSHPGEAVLAKKSRQQKDREGDAEND